MAYFAIHQPFLRDEPRMSTLVTTCELAFLLLGISSVGLNWPLSMISSPVDLSATVGQPQIAWLLNCSYFFKQIIKQDTRRVVGCNSDILEGKPKKSKWKSSWRGKSQSGSFKHLWRYDQEWSQKRLTQCQKPLDTGPLLFRSVLD